MPNDFTVYLRYLSGIIGGTVTSPVSDPHHIIVLLISVKLVPNLESLRA